jgi:hypothetical protein
MACNSTHVFKSLLTLIEGNQVASFGVRKASVKAITILLVQAPQTTRNVSTSWKVRTTVLT